MLRGSPISTRSVGTGVTRLLYGVGEQGMRQRGKDSGGRRCRGNPTQAPCVSDNGPPLGEESNASDKAPAVGTSYLDEELRKVAADGTDEVGWRCRRERRRTILF